MESSTYQSATMQHPARPLLSSTLPPLIFGTATLNYQFNMDPYALDPNTLVSSAVHAGIRAFDTSPYYGPAEEILGAALHSPLITASPSLAKFQRSDYFLLTKAGRITGNTFDYSPSWIRHSVRRSLRRLRTHYLDVVYLHDVEFVSSAEVLAAITELRRLRDEEGQIVRYIGICGYPVDVLCELAEMVVRETGEPLDIVQSYANYTLQNQRLRMRGLARLVAAGIDVVPNASPLGMGLLRGQGPPVGAMGNWHPAPDGLRAACARAARWMMESQGEAEAEKLEIVAVRFALETWEREGVAVGACGPDPADVAVGRTGGAERRGVSVMGVSTLAELEDTLRVYRSVIDGRADADSDGDVVGKSLTRMAAPEGVSNDRDWSLQRRQRVRYLAKTIREEIIGKEWADFVWDSPEPGFVNQRKAFGVSPAEREEFDRLDDTTKKEDTTNGSSAVAGS